jgi:hypothetical protein
VARICIKTSLKEEVKEELKVKINGELFTIRIMEDPLGEERQC